MWCDDKVTWANLLLSTSTSGLPSSPFSLPNTKSEKPLECSLFKVFCSKIFFGKVLTTFSCPEQFNLGECLDWWMSRVVNVLLKCWCRTIRGGPAYSFSYHVLLHPRSHQHFLSRQTRASRWQPESSQWGDWSPFIRIVIFARLEINVFVCMKGVGATLPKKNIFFFNLLLTPMNMLVSMLVTMLCAV